MFCLATRCQWWSCSVWCAEFRELVHLVCVGVAVFPPFTQIIWQGKTILFSNLSWLDNLRTRLSKHKIVCLAFLYAQGLDPDFIRCSHATRSFIVASVARWELQFPLTCAFLWARTPDFVCRHTTPWASAHFCFVDCPEDTDPLKLFRTWMHLAREAQNTMVIRVTDFFWSQGGRLTSWTQEKPPFGVFNWTVLVLECDWTARPNPREITPSHSDWSTANYFFGPASTKHGLPECGWQFDSNSATWSLKIAGGICSGDDACLPFATGNYVKLGSCFTCQ